ncbi:putative BURP domain-containing protein [Helianthus annuus]|nr:putative BURP domain-containing protein [Helianthus annuus]KAJ0949920.1 putative BURP domain-containing protein [Helianthus annuus]
MYNVLENILLALVGSHAVSPEVYWKSVLPNSPMPKAIKDLLYIKAWDDSKEKASIDSTSMNSKLKDQPYQFYTYGASKDEVKDQPQQGYIYGASKDDVKNQPQKSYIYGATKDETKDQPYQFYTYGASKDEVKDQPQQGYIYGASKDDVKNQPQKSYIYGATKDETKDQPYQFYTYGASKDEVKDQPQQGYIYRASKDDVKNQPQKSYIYGATKDEIKDQPQQGYIYGASKDEVKDQPQQGYNYGASKDDVKNQPQKSYIYGASKNQLSKNQQEHDQMVNLLFLENNLHQGEELKLHFIKNYHKTGFLPKHISDSIPFSLKDIPQIYNKFSVKPDSLEAKIMKQTLSLCEVKGIEGEETFCVTSLESMVDLSTTKLGKKVKALSTEVNAKESTPSQTYKIEFVKKLIVNKALICHRQNYAYAVFYCHTIIGTESYVVSLEGVDGTKVKAVAICHTDTTKWNPKSLAFEVLKVSPGTTICHFLHEEHVIWVPY